MKTAIDNNGNILEVEDNVPVKTINGTHYLLTPEEEAEMAAKEAAWAAGTIERNNVIATNNRKVAYISEADPLFFKYQRGEITEQEWLDKVAEIKLRYPKV